ncbi:MAG: VENN motif pre-toxin domain-containing protein [Pelistega sp.]|nr:VENN motif pre-toxin domain-containing protein [Pelistega sp.]
MSAEAAAPLLAEYIYGKKDANTLTADEKTIITGITGLIGAGVGASTGSNANIVQGVQSVQNAVEHNAMWVQQAYAEEIMKMRKEDPEQYKKFQHQQEALGLWLLNTSADFTPVVGDIKGFVEAETFGDYFFAALGAIPLVGDASNASYKTIKTSYEAAKQSKDVDGMMGAVSQAAAFKKQTDLTQRYGKLDDHWFVNGEAHWLNPLTNSFEKIPANAKVSVDHILPKKYLEEMVSGFEKLPKNIQKQLMDTPENLQPMVHLANCSKGCKVEFVGDGWKTWNGQEINQGYKRYLHEIQDDIAQKTKDYLSRYERINNEK